MAGRPADRKSRSDRENQERQAPLNTPATPYPTELERVLANAVQHSGELFNLATLDGQMVYINQTGARMLGIDPADTAGHNIIDVIPVHMRKKVQAEVLDALSRGQTWEGELQYLNLLTGQLTDVQAMTFPIIDTASGSVLYLANVSRDLTERKRAENSLRKSEETLREALENAPDGVYMNDMDGNFLYGNRKCEEMIGYAREEMVGKNFLELGILPEGQLARAAELLQANSEGKSTGPDELELKRKDGKVIPVEVSTSVIQRGGRSVVLAFARDISSRRQAEAMLRESEQRFHRIAENVPDCIFRYRLKPDRAFEYISPAAKQIIGYEPEEFYADPLLAIKAVHPADHTRYREHFLSADSLRQVLYLRWLHRDGREVWTEEIDVPVFDEKGDIVAYEGIVRDVTERKKTEDALMESEARYRLLAEHTSDAVTLMDMDLRITYHSPSSLKRRGYTPEEVMNVPLDKQLTPSSLQRALEAYNREMPMVQADQDYNPVITLDLEYYRRDGTTMWSESNFSFIRDSSGKPAAILGESRDITERKVMEQALAESERRLADIISHVNDVVYTLDADRQLSYVSPQAEQLLGYTLVEIKNNWRHYKTDSATNTKATEITSRAYNTGLKQEPFLQEFVRRDGTLRWVEMNESPLKNERGEVTGIVGAARDVTERIRIELALRENEEKYRLVVENAQEVIFIAVDGMVRFANGRGSEVSGFTFEEFRSRPFIEFIHPGDRKMITDRYLKWLSGQEVPQTDTVRIIIKSGETRWVEMSVVPITWEGKQATLAFLNDVTDRKRLEEERQRVEKLESLGLLAGGIAHDFNNILTALLGNISLARLEARPGSEAYESLEQAEKASIRARDLTQQLLTFSSGGAPTRKLSSLSELLGDTAGFALRGSNVSCSLSLPADLWHAEIDAGQVSQVIHNLVINAQQAMPSGGIVEVHAENMVINRGQRLGRGLPLQPGRYIRVCVTDHGIGIRPEHLDKVFDPFFTTKQKGSGLGLATSFSIIRGHGGHLSVESEPGAGSTFYVYLPASEERTLPAPDDKTAALPPIAARILVMDDEKPVREVAERMLKRLGYDDVVLTADGTAAVAAYRASMEAGRTFSAVILDLTIPGAMGGVETVRELCRLDPKVRAIVSSGYAHEAVMADYREMGFCGIAAKPYTIEQLGKAVSEALAREGPDR